MKATFTDPKEAFLDSIAPLLEEAEKHDEEYEATLNAVRIHMTSAGATPFDLPLSMKVCEVHARWNDYIEAASQWTRLYAEKIKPIWEELAELPKGERTRRRDLRIEFEKLTEYGTMGDQCLRAEFSDAQMALQEAAEARAIILLSKRLPKLKGRKLEKHIEDALIHFNELWSERCYLEMTWQWTLEQCLSTALFGPEPAPTKSTKSTKSTK